MWIFFSINTTVLCGPWLVEFEDVELTTGRENPQILVSTASPGTSPLQIQMKQIPAPASGSLARILSFSFLPLL